MSEAAASKAHLKLAELLARETGQQLLANRHWRVEMALKPLMRKHSIPDIAMLASLLGEDGDRALQTECVELMIKHEILLFCIREICVAYRTGSRFDPCGTCFDKKAAYLVCCLLHRAGTTFACHRVS